MIQPFSVKDVVNILSIMKMKSAKYILVDSLQSFNNDANLPLLQKKTPNKTKNN